MEIIGIPLHLWTVKNLKNIGKKLGHVDTIELSAGRLLVEADTRKSLVFNKKVQSPRGDEVTIQFKYEKLFKHCSYCGFLSHEATHCPKKMEEQRLQAKEGGVFSQFISLLSQIHANLCWLIEQSVIVINMTNVTLRDKGEPRAINFSHMEKENYMDDMENGQVIGALQDMDIGNQMA